MIQPIVHTVLRRDVHPVPHLPPAEGKHAAELLITDLAGLSDDRPKRAAARSLALLVEADRRVQQVRAALEADTGVADPWRATISAASALKETVKEIVKRGARSGIVLPPAQEALAHFRATPVTGDAHEIADAAATWLALLLPPRADDGAPVPEHEAETAIDPAVAAFRGFGLVPADVAHLKACSEALDAALDRLSPGSVREARTLRAEAHECLGAAVDGAFSLTFEAPDERVAALTRWAALLRARLHRIRAERSEAKAERKRQAAGTLDA